MTNNYLMKKYNLEVLNEEQEKAIKDYNSKNIGFIAGLVALAGGSYIFSNNNYAMYGVYIGAIVLGALAIRERFSLKDKLLKLKDNN